MTVAEQFEARYRRDPDPWGYRTSPYERAKYAATIRACGPGPFASGLELGCSIGELTAMLAGRCERLTAIDASETAVKLARNRLRSAPIRGEVDVVEGTFPADLPRGPFDLVVASEVLYYLTADELEATLAKLKARTRSGARLVAVHYAPEGAERPLSAAEIHARLRDLDWLAPLARRDHGPYLLDVMERR